MSDATANTMSDLTSGVVTFLVGASIAFEAYRLPDPQVDVLGPSAFPLALGIVIALCGAAIVVAQLLATRRAAGPLQVEPARWGLLAAALVLLVLYTQGIARLGFPVMTALFSAAFLVALGERGALRITAASLGISLVIYVLFGVLLGVDLPLGKVFGR